MATVTVRGLDDAVVRRLEARAAANNLSLEAELRRILETAVAEPDYQARKRAFAEYSKELRALTGRHGHTPSEDLIRASRDSGYGRAT